MKLKRLDPTIPTEYQRVLALWDAAGLTYKPAGRDAPQAIERQMSIGTHTFIGMENDAGELIGVVLATHDGRKGWINRLAIHPDVRRQGLALELLQAAEDTLHEQGIQVTAALIEPGNDASLALFIKSGYTDWSAMHYVTKRDHRDV